MARIDDMLAAGLQALPPKPLQNASREIKKRYSESVSQTVAYALADELRARGLSGARPAPPGVLDTSGAERRMAGGLGSKKVDVTWATPESGLLLAISVKSINFCDNKTKTFQKNLTNRRGDMLIEAVTLHRRFPYSVLSGFFLLDNGAENDGTINRRSTFLNAHAQLQLFTGRNDPAGRDEQFERFYLLLMNADTAKYDLRAYEVGRPHELVPLNDVITTLLRIAAERNPDFYELDDSSSLRPAFRRNRRRPRPA